ncbi:MAG: heme o synthase [Actinomycetia bacterium]|nr:heme o synthase [Actinomycetes bacterium]
MSARRSDTAEVPSTLATYIEMTKPRIIELLLVTTVPAMVVAAGGWPGSWLVLWALVGGALSAGGANVINQVYDRDIDRIMARTRNRPLPTNRTTATSATVFGVTLGILGFVVLWAGTTLLAGVLSVVAFTFYVFVYTMLLKRSSTQNIVIGGAAGAVPALIGWAAVTGDLAMAAWVMFSVIFFWTPPHFWALSLKYEDDYRKAEIPMFPVVAGAQATFEQILWYSVVTVGATLMLIPVAGLGWIYAVVAVVLGAPMIAIPVRLRGGSVKPMRYFVFTNLYLASIFLAMMIDRLVFDTGIGATNVWMVIASVAVIGGLTMVALVERRPEVRLPKNSALRHTLEVTVTMMAGLALVVASWMSIA